MTSKSGFLAETPLENLQLLTSSLTTSLLKKPASKSLTTSALTALSVVSDRSPTTNDLNANHKPKHSPVHANIVEVRNTPSPTMRLIDGSIARHLGKFATSAKSQTTSPAFASPNLKLLLSQRWPTTILRKRWWVPSLKNRQSHSLLLGSTLPPNTRAKQTISSSLSMPCKARTRVQLLMSHSHIMYTITWQDGSRPDHEAAQLFRSPSPWTDQHIRSLASTCPSFSNLATTLADPATRMLYVTQELK